MKQYVVICIHESLIIREGLKRAIELLKRPIIYYVSVENLSDFEEKIQSLQPSLLFVDSITVSSENIFNIKKYIPSCKIIGIISANVPLSKSKIFDRTIDLYVSLASLDDIFKDLRENKEDELKELSPREKEILIGVVKGLSNKEIACENHISVHTVMTHRKNIATKLQIHSTAGLTIYAIVSKLVKIEDLKI